MTETTTCPWDPARLQLIAPTPDDEQLILTILLDQGAKAVATMQACSSDEQVGEWRRAVHGIRGSAANLGMEGLLAYCKEDKESTATHAQRGALLDSIRTELQQIAHYKHMMVTG